MKVPLLDVNAQNLPLEAELTAAFTGVLRSGQFIMGPEVEALEQECAAMVGAAHGIGCSSGTDAILLALMALGIGPGDEVLVPTFTFFATAGCVSRVGATPVFVDACPVCFNVDPAKAAARITPKTKAIIPVHLFGQSADMDAVMALAAEHNLFVIEDGAQAIGAKYKGRPVGSIGHFGTYSFFPSKNLGGFGDGGLLVANDDALADRARLLRTHGSRPKYYHQFVGGNFRLDALQAALLRVKLRRYDDYTKARQANAAYYTAKLGALPSVAVADTAHPGCAHSDDALTAAGAKLVLPAPYAHNDHIWNQYTLRVIGEGRRDALKKHLADNGIGCEIYYPVTMDQQQCFQYTPARCRTGCEVAHQLATEVISIPIYPELQPAQLDGVIETISSWVAS
ncbi:MAG: DegT/DnrJ/EryC1/StrS family aminotransferase [Verrucomicrobiales bacterium]|nr:DegT/DnrJ/EryC1/StrS family aminotransferase [Verrucomicrobiales bacterium]